ncbi:hypothetical protein [Methylosinus sporium]|uniref:hypothetical protein n=1 Tax=Methylosinus sporium TaxID=428 RepID=UPI00383A83E9
MNYDRKAFSSDAANMHESERSQFLNQLDEELLRGGVQISEWCCFLVCEFDTTYIAGAYLSSIIVAMAGIETHLRTEYPFNRQKNLFDLIDSADLNGITKQEIHELRRYRNRWVHISNPDNDDDILTNPEKYATELEEVARRAARILREVIYSNPWI